MRFLMLLGIFLMTNAAAANFMLTSASFKNSERIPVKYTCLNEDVSPQLAWTGTPKKTQSFALICADPDAPAGTFYHWVAFNIPVTVNQLNENSSAGIIGKNSANQNAYKGPCPPPGKIHHYIFTLYALDTSLNLPADTDAKQLEAAIKGHVLESTTLVGLFNKE